MKYCVHSHVGVSLVESKGHIRPCCKFYWVGETPTIFDVDSLDRVHELPFYKNIQQQLQSGEWPEHCRDCASRESAGLQSRRQFTNKMYASNNWIEPGYIQDLEIAMDYTCNMMCRSCSAGASSKWGSASTVLEQFAELDIETDSVKNYKDYSDRFKQVLANTDLSRARHVKLEGGEPFYSKHFDWFVDKLYTEADHTKLRLNITTNGSVFPRPQTLEKLQKLRATISYSLDGYGELASTLRWGVDWQTIENNICRMRDTTLSLTSNITVGLGNIGKLQPLRDFLLDMRINDNYSFITHPEYLSVYQFDVATRKQWCMGIDKFDKELLADINIEPELDKFVSSNSVLDDYQQLTLRDVNPQIYEVVDAYQRK